MKSLSRPVEDRDDGQWTVNCSCGVTFDDGEKMVSCDEHCGVWVHARCYRFVHGEVSFRCLRCTASASDVFGHDTEVTEFADIPVELSIKTQRRSRLGKRRKDIISGEGKQVSWKEKAKCHSEGPIQSAANSEVSSQREGAATPSGNTFVLGSSPNDAAEHPVDESMNRRECEDIGEQMIPRLHLLLDEGIQTLYKVIAEKDASSETKEEISLLKQRVAMLEAQLAELQARTKEEITQLIEVSIAKVEKSTREWQTKYEKEMNACSRQIEDLSRIYDLEKIVMLIDGKTVDQWRKIKADTFEKTMVFAAQRGWLKTSSIKDPLFKALLPNRFEEVRVAVLNNSTRDDQGWRQQ